ncbi:MAG: hypothetical protein M1816_005444 [Peltula sp. TS41687]|nr:MAG: hypothetical protein M1816_005444 [Peltula sp. TS41687]
MRISRAAAHGSPLESTISYDPLPALETTWHPQRIDVLSLKQTERHRPNVHEVLFREQPAISKIACVDWMMPRMDNETWAYSIIGQHQQQHPGELAITPTFLGHVTENGRVIGFLLEKVGGEFASLEDLPPCEEALRRLHGMGLVHGDAHRSNFLVERDNAGSGGHVRMVDFEHVEPFDETQARWELELLASELAEETGRGGPAVEIR